MLLPIIILILAFFILFKAAGYLVDCAVRIAELTGVPTFLIGVLLVGLGTTAPELAVSVIAAFLGHPEIALGNAVGSVICDDAFALGLAAIVAPVAITVRPGLIRKTAFFIIGVDLLAYALILNGYVGRLEGVLLLSILIGYYFYTLAREKKRRRAVNEVREHGEESLTRLGWTFIATLLAVIGASRGVVWAAVRLAECCGISDAVIGLTVIAIGTSLPEISTCLVAARKGEGELAVGDILGADILNILWIIGMSATVNPIAAGKNIIHFAFPWMIGVVVVMLLFLRMGYRLGKMKGLLLVGMYVVYLVWTVKLFY